MVTSGDVEKVEECKMKNDIMDQTILMSRNFNWPIDARGVNH